MKKFEYHVEEISWISPSKIAQDLWELGEDGWELVAITGQYTYVFKREVTA